MGHEQSSTSMFLSHQSIDHIRVLTVAYCGGGVALWMCHDQACERLVAQSQGEYAVGDTVSIADICLVPQLENARRFGINVDQFPHLSSLEQRLKDLPAFAAALPERQPDATPA
eukprot:Skav214094  [mRNA]  locus=scaffold1185:81212:84567:+ [translate_table: standard]